METIPCSFNDMGEIMLMPFLRALSGAARPSSPSLIAAFALAPSPREFGGMVFGSKCFFWPAMLAAATLVFSTSPAAAQTTTDFSTGTTNTANFMQPPGLGQIFTVPTGVTHITSVSLGVTQVNGTDNYQLSLNRYSGGGLGPEIQSSAETISAAAAFPAYEIDTLTLAGAGLPVTAGEQFVILASSPFNFSSGVPFRADVYPDGVYFDGIVEKPASDTFFRVTYTDGVVAAPVPTLSEWTMILFGAALAGGAALLLQRRRQID